MIFLYLILIKKTDKNRIKYEVQKIPVTNIKVRKITEVKYNV